MGYNKFITESGEVLLDLTNDTVLPSSLDKGVTAHDRHGLPIVGTRESGESGNLSINGIIREYEVNAGASVSAGDFVEFVNKFGAGEFSTTTSNHISACKLDNERVFIAYADNGNGGYGTAVVVRLLSNGTVNIGKTNVFYSKSTSHITATALNNNTVSISHYYYTSADKLYALRIAKITDEDEINIQSSYIPSDRWRHTSKVSSVKMNENEMLLIHTNSDYGDKRHLACLISTADATFINGDYEVADLTVTKIQPVALMENKVLYFYGNDASVYYSVITKTTDGTIATGKKSFIDATAFSACKLDDKRALFVYDKSTVGRACIFEVNGSTPTPHTPIIFSESSVSELCAVSLSDNKAIVFFNNGNILYGSVLSTDGTTITMESTKVIAENNVNSISAFAMSDSSVFVTYVNSNGASEYKSIFVNNDNTIVLDEQLETQGTFVQKATSNLHNVGVAKTSGTEGETVEVYCAV